jgi:peroxiredoxin
MPTNPLARRVTFVVDQEGTIRKIYTVQKIKEHPAEVLAFVKTLGAK